MNQNPSYFNTPNGQSPVSNAHTSPITAQPLAHNNSKQESAFTNDSEDITSKGSLSSLSNDSVMKTDGQQNLSNAQSLNCHGDSNIQLEAQSAGANSTLNNQGPEDLLALKGVQDGKASAPGAGPSPPAKGAYSAFPAWRRAMILWIVTLAGFLGPLSGSIYLPVLTVIKQDFNISTTAANATVSVFMAVFAVAVCIFH